jgi:hypothetical protein
VAAIAAGGDHHTCALTRAGGVKCWGQNAVGELGNGKRTGRHTPVGVVGLARGVAAIAAGGSHTCALTRARRLKCWGWNENGQIGDGTMIDRHTPVGVVGFGASLKCLVPNLRHMMLSSAKIWLKRAHCSLGRVATRPSTLKNKGLVLAQQPKPSTKLRNRAKVNVTVGSGP